MKKVTHFSIVALASCLALSSCDDKNEAFDGAANLPDQEILIPATARAADFSTLRESATPAVTEAEEFAKMLALSLKDPEMRKFLKSEANKQFDGDFDILVKNVVSVNVGNARFDEKVKNSSSKGYAAGNQAFSKALSNPLLNIAVPMLIETWNDTKQLPLVAVAVGANEKETKQLKAFDSNGKTYLIDAKIEPNVPVIVVANNERVNLPGFKAGLHPGSQKNARVNAVRNSGGMDRITYIKCPNLSDIESWYFGGPELQFDGVVYNNSFSAAFKSYTKMVSPSRNSAKDGFNLSQNLFEWYFDDNHGPDYYSETVLKYQFSLLSMMLIIARYTIASLFLVSFS